MVAGEIEHDDVLGGGPLLQGAVDVGGADRLALSAVLARVVDRDHGPLDRLGELYHHSGESRLVLGGHGIRTRGERGPGVEDEERGSQGAALVDQPGDVQRIEEVEAWADEEREVTLCRSCGPPGAEDVVAAALQARPAVLAGHVEDFRPRENREVPGDRRTVGGDRQAAIQAQEALVALRGPAPPNDAPLRCRWMSLAWRNS